MSVDTIVAELHRLRGTQSEHEVMGATASTSTLIVYAGDPEAFSEATGPARKMAIAHGARLLLLDASGRSREARVCAFCGRAGSETICCEEITLPIDPSRSGVAVADVEELLLPGLPSYLWWSDGRVETPLFRGLHALAKHIVVDTSLAADPTVALIELDRMLSHDPHAYLWDIAWLRNAPWREMAARLFDDPERAAALARLEAIEIEGGSLGEAALMAGWIGAQLGYTVPERSHHLRTATGARVSFAHRGTPQPVCAVRLRTDTLTFSASLEGSASVCLSMESAQEQRSRCEPLMARALDDLVREALYGIGADPAFPQALALAAGLVAG
ncbi:hypothetical protein EPN44_04155 [bacterium]|nr:MAG: hypothetical protein EPN44_04155 [bacterium]